MSRIDLVKQELARRELARRDLAAFAWYTYRQYRAAAVHRLLAQHLMAVERFIATRGAEGIGRLMVFMPPRHGKSELVSVRFPAWFLGRNPDMRVIVASCTASLATGFSRQTRDIIRDEPFQAIFGDKSGLDPEAQVLLSQESRSAESWDLQGHPGGLVAAGVGGSIVGRGMHLGIIDDPFKNREEAESERVRDMIDDWYRSTFYTRLEESGAIVLMHQRWHFDDLAGRLLRRMIEDAAEDQPSADQWVVLNLPAIAEPWAEAVAADEVIEAAKSGWWKGVDALGREPGTPLWESKYDLTALNKIRVNVGTYDWDAMYQQRPQRLEGALIKAYNIHQVRADQVPQGLHEVRYWDLAVSGRKRADYISGARVGRSSDGKLYIRHIARLPGPWADAKAKIIEQILRDPAAVTHGIETSGQQAGYFQELQRDPRLVGRAIVGVNPQAVGNKEVRANIWASRIPDGLVHLVAANGWDVDGFLSEAVAFPLGAHDDQVDAVSGAVQMLPATVAFGEVPQAPDVPSKWDPFGEGGGGGRWGEMGSFGNLE